MSRPQTFVVATKLTVFVSGRVQLEVKCPFCDRRHYHGGGFNLEDIKEFPISFGTRCPDCPIEIPLRDYAVSWDFAHTVLSFEKEKCGHLFISKCPKAFHTNLFSVVPLILPNNLN